MAEYLLGKAEDIPEGFYEECRKLQEEIVRDDPARTESQADLALTVMNLGSTYLEMKGIGHLQNLEAPDEFLL